MFESRSVNNEYLDSPDCDPDLATASYRFMETVNCRFGGIKVVQRFLHGEAASRTSSAPLRILDIGSGSCDIPLAVSRWAHLHGIPLHFTCLEITAPAIDLARRRLAIEGCPDVQLLCENAFSHNPAEPYDCAVASMCFHHFSNAQILTLLQRLRSFVLNSVLINDLRRSGLSFLATSVLLTFARTPSTVRHDALLSIRRGFRVSELRALLGELDGAVVSVEPARWFRVAATIRFDSGGTS